MPDAARQTLSFLMRRFQESGIQPRNKFGQNFLIDLNLLGVLFDGAGVGPNDVVLEVGTGTGSLTAMLAGSAAAVVTVEVDPQMFQLAEEELLRFDNVAMLQIDALAGKNSINPTVLDAVEKQLAVASDRQWKLVANLPYNIATPVLGNLLALENPPVSMTATIQKELADRIVAKPGTKDYSALSVWIQSQCQVEILRTLPPEAFWPRPTVSSAFVRITVDADRRGRIPDRKFFHEFARAMFLHRRKFLRSELLCATKDKLDRDAVDAILTRLNIDGTIRAEQLDVASLLAIGEAVRTAGH
jgi:16S rRNA (adenine1518-N6/adenine1519-N6)-dimethyltransferase